MYCTIVYITQANGKYNDRSYQKEAGEYASLLDSIRSEITQMRNNGDSFGTLSCDILSRVERLIEIACEREFRSGYELESRTAFRSCTAAAAKGLKLPKRGDRRKAKRKNTNSYRSCGGCFCVGYSIRKLVKTFYAVSIILLTDSSKNGHSFCACVQKNSIMLAA